MEGRSRGERRWKGCWEERKKGKQVKMYYTEDETSKNSELKQKKYGTHG